MSPGSATSSTFKANTLVSYIANNNNDQQYFERLSNFLEAFLLKSHDSWLLKWVPTLMTVFVKKATETPRISKLYALIKTVLMICSKNDYFKVDMRGQRAIGQRGTGQRGTLMEVDEDKGVLKHD